MKRLKLPIDINIVNNAIATCIRAGQFDTALRVYDQADVLTGKDKLRERAADKYTYALLLLIYSKVPYPERVIPVRSVLPKSFIDIIFVILLLFSINIKIIIIIIILFFKIVIINCYKFRIIVINFHS